MRTRMLRRLVAAAIGLSLVAWAPASLLCPQDGSDAAHGSHARAAGGAIPAQHAHGGHDTQGPAHAPAQEAPAPADAPADAPDCPLAFVAGCIPSVLASSVARVTEPIPDRAAEPDWVVATESDHTVPRTIFRPPIG